MRTRAQTRKENLEKEKEEAIVTMGEQVANAKALMDFSQPKINDIQSSIVRPAIAATTFEIKSGTI